MNLLNRPPIQQSTGSTSGLGVDAVKKNLTSKLQQSKWSINIQEIVKKTQKNLERGPSSQKAGSIGVSSSVLDQNNQFGLNSSHSN